MSQNRGIVMQKPQEAGIAEISIPKLRDDYVLIKVKAVALNPTDWKHIAYVAPPGARIGCDFAGIVEEVGSAVTKPFKKGDRIAGFAHGGNAVYHEDGAFSNYITAKGDVQFKIPDNLSFEEAASLGVGLLTVGQVLYHILKLPYPGDVKGDEKEKLPILIYGGSTATGSLAIQFAKLSGAMVVTTCSPRNFEYVKSLGADAAFDYNSPTCAEDIKAITKGNLTHVLDCISEGVSPSICIPNMSTTAPGSYVTLIPVPDETLKSLNPSGNITQTIALAYFSIGEAFTFVNDMEMPAKPEIFAFARTFMDIAAGLLAEGKVKPHRVVVDKHGSGLEGVMKGMEAMKNNEVSGEKLVYKL